MCLPALQTLDVCGASLARQRLPPVPGWELTWVAAGPLVVGCPHLRALAYTRAVGGALSSALGAALPLSMRVLTVQVCPPPPPHT